MEEKVITLTIENIEVNAKEFTLKIPKLTISGATKDVAMRLATVLEKLEKSANEELG